MCTFRRCRRRALVTHNDLLVHGFAETHFEWRTGKRTIVFRAFYSLFAATPRKSSILLGLDCDGQTGAHTNTVLRFNNARAARFYVYLSRWPRLSADVRRTGYARFSADRETEREFCVPTSGMLALSAVNLAMTLRPTSVRPHSDRRIHGN